MNQKSVRRIAHGLFQRGMLRMPAVLWDRAGLDAEKIALNRAGVLFEAFQVTQPL